MIYKNQHWIIYMVREDKELDKIKTPIEYFNNIEMKVLIYSMSIIEVILLFVAIILATWIILSKHDDWKF